MNCPGDNDVIEVLSSTPSNDVISGMFEKQFAGILVIKSHCVNVPTAEVARVVFANRPSGIAPAIFVTPNILLMLLSSVFVENIVPTSVPAIAVQL